jgi:DNA-binding HxlR family transcriptional regulator
MISSAALTMDPGFRFLLSVLYCGPAHQAIAHAVTRSARAGLTLTNRKSYADDDPRSGARAVGNPFAATKELLVLSLLRDEPMGLYGLEIVKASNGRLQRGTVYVTLGRLEEKGFVKSAVNRKPDHPGLPRPRYSLTGQGQRVLEAAQIMGLNVVRA